MTDSFPNLPNTRFAPAHRATETELKQSRHEFKAQKLMSDMLEAFPGPAFVLNGFRQVVAMNRRGLLLSGQTEEQVLGKRPGELFGCTNAESGPGGCGTSSACSVCGAVQAILQSQATGEPNVRECRIPAQAFGGICLELELHTTPMTISGHPFLVCALRDISLDNRSRSLERVFFHDLLNSLGIIRGLADQMLKLMPAGTGDEAVLHDAIRSEIQHLLEEVLAHRFLQQAENGELKANLCGTQLRGFVEQLARSCQAHDCARQRSIVVDQPVPELELITDERLLRRILVNLIKNALEAVPAGESIRLRCLNEEQGIRFEVWNPGYIPVPVQYQIFQKSFSTKEAKGRGLGTYSARLLGERGLGGKLSFTSTPETGTTFTFLHPRISIS